MKISVRVRARAVTTRGHKNGLGLVRGKGEGCSCILKYLKPGQLKINVTLCHDSFSLSPSLCVFSNIKLPDTLKLQQVYGIHFFVFHLPSLNCVTCMIVFGL